jgi:hypothetical protein
LEKCCPTFRENKSGWGIDHVWVKWLKYPTDKVAIIDDVVAVHTRPVGHGDMYKNQGNGMKSAWKDWFAISQKYNMKNAYPEYTGMGKPISYLKAFNNIVEYGRINKDLGCGMEDRIWPQAESTKTLCKVIRDT